MSFHLTLTQIGRRQIYLKASGRIVYAAAEFAGVWRSDDYGITWRQLIRPQPSQGAATTDGLDVPSVLDVVVSPTNPKLVFAATDIDNRNNPSRAGIYRSTDGGETWSLVYQFRCSDGVKPASQVIFAPGNPLTLYAVGGCQIVFSTNGVDWADISPQEVISGTKKVWHIAMSAPLPGEKRRGFACGDDTLWYSPDGKRWYIDTVTSTALPKDFCGATTTGQGNAAQVLAIEPGKPNHVFLAIGHHANGPSYYHLLDAGPKDDVRANNPIVYDSNSNGQYDASDAVIWRQDNVPPLPTIGVTLLIDSKITFVDTSPNNGQWDNGETVVYDTTGDGIYSALPQIKADSTELVEAGTAPPVGTKLSNDTKIKYVDMGAPFGLRGAGEGSLWYGDFSTFDPAHADTLKGSWEILPGPPVYFGGSTHSGGAYVFTHPTKDGYLVFFSNKESVHVSVGKPVAGRWHRLGARDASESKRQNDLRNVLYIHVDPHGLAISPDFDLSLIRSDQPYPYNQNWEIKRPISPTTANLPTAETCHGRIWLSNDGGVYRSDDCGQNWISSYAGLTTLAAFNIAGVARQADKPGQPNPAPALYFGTRDNDDYYSLDGGQTWHSPEDECGDCDTWFADPAQPNRVLRLSPRRSAFDVFASTHGYPDAGDTSQRIRVPYPDGVIEFAGSAMAISGYRSIIQTLANEDPLPNGDYIAIQEIQSQGGTKRVLLRARDSINAATPFVQEGPDLPAGFTVNVVQAAGGHAAPTYYIGDQNHLWKSHRDGQGKIDQWQVVVPGGDPGNSAKQAKQAQRFFVNAYDSNDIYIVDTDTIRHSIDGGQSWPVDMPLEGALTAGGEFIHWCPGAFCILNDLVFDRESTRRFALGLAGIFYSNDGIRWFRLVDTRALPSRPRGAYFDPITDPNDRSLYIAFEGRGIMRYHPIP